MRAETKSATGFMPVAGCELYFAQDGQSRSLTSSVVCHSSSIDSGSKPARTAARTHSQSVISPRCSQSIRSSFSTSRNNRAPNSVSDPLAELHGPSQAPQDQSRVRFSGGATQKTDRNLRRIIGTVRHRRNLQLYRAIKDQEQARCQPIHLTSHSSPSERGGFKRRKKAFEGRTMPHNEEVNS